MASKELEEVVSPESWAELATRELADFRAVPGVAGFVPRLLVSKVDFLLSELLINRPFTSMDELLDEGFTIDSFVNAMGIPDTPKTSIPQGDFLISERQAIGAAVRKRLGTTVKSGVIKRLNSGHGLWLVTTTPLNVEGKKGLSRYGATKDDDLINRLHLIPTTERQVVIQVNATVTALTVAARVPSMTAKIIAAQDTKIAAAMVARQRAYDVVTAELSPSAKLELDAAIGAQVGTYATLMKPKFEAIEAAKSVDQHDEEDETEEVETDSDEEADEESATEVEPDLFVTPTRPMIRRRTAK